MSENRDYAIQSESETSSNSTVHNVAIFSRKRKRNDDAHKKNVELGKEHLTKSGNIVQAKVFESQTICKCVPYCSTKIVIERQQELFNTFYYESNHAQKTLLRRASVKTFSAQNK